MSNRLLLYTVLAVLLGIGAGCAAAALPWAAPLVPLCGFVGQLFLRALALVVVPLVAAALITGCMRLGGEGALGALGGKTLAAFLISMVSAVTLGMAAVAFWQPTIDGGEALTAAGALVEKAGAATPWQKIGELFLRIVPQNIVAAASQGEIIGLIAFCALFGVMVSRGSGEGYDAVRNFWQGTFQTLVSMTQKIMLLMPLGLFALMVQTTATTGGAGWHGLLGFAAVVVGALLLFALLLLGAAWLLGGMTPWRLVAEMSAPLLTAFTTSSSAAALPVALQALRDLGVPVRVSSLVLSLGVAVNLAGSALYASAVVTLIALQHGMLTDLGGYILVWGVTLVSCFGMAGVPSASLIVIVVILKTLELPADQLAYILAIERFVDMIRTAVNLLASSVCAIIVSREERSVAV